MKRVMGVYKLYNLANGKRYVGGSLNVLQRKKQHFFDLNHGKSRSSEMQKDFDEYGKKWFEFVVLEVVADEKDLVAVEQKWIDLLHPEYNVNPVAGQYIGEYIRTPEAKEKSRRSKLGRHWHSKE